MIARYGLLVCGLFAAAPLLGQPSFQGLGNPPGYNYLEAIAVSADGQFIAGTANRMADNKYAAFRWSPAGGFTWLGDLPGGDNDAVSKGFSAHGFHVVGYSDTADGEEGFRWQGGAMTGIGDGPASSNAFGISYDGSVVVGFDWEGLKTSAFVWVRGGPLAELGTLNGSGTSYGYGVSFDGSVAVGRSSSDNGYEAFRWTAAGGMVGLGDLAGGTFESEATAVSGDGSVAVGYGKVAEGYEAVRWTKATGMVGLGELAGGIFSGLAFAASADGSVIVGRSNNGADQAFIWDSKNGMRLLKDVLVAAGAEGLTGWTLSAAYGLSGDGLTIAGIGTDPDGIDKAWVAYLGPSPFTPQDTDLVSLSATEQLGNSGSTLGSVSNDGGVVAFYSNATNLVAGDTNGRADVFIRNIPSEWTNRVSVSSSGVQGNGDSLNARICGNGRFVVFASDATNLVAGDTSARRDIFIHDRTARTTTRLSVSSGGAQANGNSDLPQISPDGRYIVFQSDATNLVPGDTNSATDIFLRDRLSSTTIRVSVNSVGQQATGPSFQPHLSDNGLSIVFASDAANLVPGDNNFSTDIFLRNRQTNQTVIVSAGSGEAQIGNGDSTTPRISGNGRYITYTSEATNLVFGDSNGVADVFVRDRFNATTMRISMAPNQANAESAAVAISANGRFVLYQSTASNLVKDDTNGVRDVFLHDGWTFLTRRVSLGVMGVQANAACSGSAISADGRFVLFNSNAGNLVPFDSNGKSDVFLGRLPLP
jgi:probable HAF family extracellular repeat protein